VCAPRLELEPREEEERIRVVRVLGKYRTIEALGFLALACPMVAYGVLELLECPR
jgi:hypothetical protein